MTRTASASRPTRRPAKGAPSRAKPLVSKDYWTQSQLPLTSLVFLLTPLAIYELGTRYLTRQEIIAFRLVADFFNLLGATGPHLPALAVVAVLLAMHVARNDRWRVEPKTIVTMALESLILAIPVIGLAIISARYLPRLPLAGELALATAGPSKLPMLVLSFGAGIYEELVFRLFGFNLLHVLIVDLMKVPRQRASLLIVVIPAILFSVYHYLGAEHFTLHSFVFRTLAGIYFGIVFLYRGFGITAGTHAAYDVIVVLLS